MVVEIFKWLWVWLLTFVHLFRFYFCFLPFMEEDTNETSSNNVQRFKPLLLSTEKLVMRLHNSRRREQFAGNKLAELPAGIQDVRYPLHSIFLLFWQSPKFPIKSNVAPCYMNNNSLSSSRPPLGIYGSWSMWYCVLHEKQYGSAHWETIEGNGLKNTQTYNKRQINSPAAGSVRASPFRSPGNVKYFIPFLWRALRHLSIVPSTFSSAAWLMVLLPFAYRLFARRRHALVCVPCGSPWPSSMQSTKGADYNN